MKRFLGAVGVFIAATAFASSDPTYVALRAARPDGRVIEVKDLAFDRDAYHITLTGSLYPLAPVDGVTAGAVFVGTGAYTLTPATDDELQQLRIESADEKLTALNDTFDSAVFFDTALLKAAGEANSGTPNPNATKTFDEFLKKERKDFNTNFHIRVLQEMLDPLPQPLFLAYVRGHKLPPAILAYDQRGADALHIWEIGDNAEKTVLFVNDQQKGGYWYL